jgi:murein DD-endopeptidase MepM/ murein hydrolase activator NlpD
MGATPRSKSPSPSTTAQPVVVAQQPSSRIDLLPVHATERDRQTLMGAVRRNAKTQAIRKQRADRAAARAARAAARAAERARPKWVRPITSDRLTAGFGASSGLWANRHTGQDFASPSGTPVRAVGDGVIISAGYDGAYGNKIVVRHADGTETWYAHLSTFERDSGSVKAGELIGRVGSTGNTTGSHLHFEVRPGGGEPVNPLGWLRTHGVRV